MANGTTENVYDASFYENCWNELLKASREWQHQIGVDQLLSSVCKKALELLSAKRSVAFLLDRNGLHPRAQWPQSPGVPIMLETGELELAQSVIQAGRSAFLHKKDASQAHVVLCAPFTASREILGALYLEFAEPHRPVKAKDQQFVDMLAQQAASCLEHAVLYQSAITDPLTGLYCHRHFQQEVEQTVRRAIRNELPLTLLLMDLDHFKALNDNCGHEAGNQCLLRVTEILRSTFRRTDVVARFGGDEFEILLPDTKAGDAESVAEKARESIAAIPLPLGRKVSATIGIASYPENALEAQALFLRADEALYAAKEAGRNRIARAQGTTVHVSATGRDATRDRARKPADAEFDSTKKIAQPISHVNAPAVQMIDGHVVLRKLGVGSTGEILLVNQPGLEREVVLKRPLTPHLSFVQAQAFEQEARTTASLNHPGVVPIFNIGRDQDSRRYYTMKPLEGLSLAEILDRRRKGDMDLIHIFTNSRLLEILQRVCETIAYAHKRNVQHLDLTPSNIIVGEFGEVTVIDWAGSSSPGADASSGEDKQLKVIGSPAYIAPEILRGGPSSASPASDVFALGTLFYLLLTDQLPFQGASTSETVEAILTGSAVPPDLLLPTAGIDGFLSSICMQALALEPSKRLTAQGLSERLGRYVRREMDWTILRFGAQDRPVDSSEWTTRAGSWKLRAGEWVTCGPDTEYVLLWNVPVPGSFRFICEAWIEPGAEATGEISLIGHHGRSRDARNSLYHGYFFQVGAEQNTAAKLARHVADTVVAPGWTLVPGRRYRIELEYQDQEGYVHCAVDGKRIFSYRELFPFDGSLLGFYAVTAGTHFRPLEVHRQNWNLQIPALRAADRLYSQGHTKDALECYQEIAVRQPDRMESTEATLKIGLCQAALGQIDAARQTLHSLANTHMEPFALAEEAMICMSDTELCFNIFSTLFEKFPDSQAKTRVMDALGDLRSFLNPQRPLEWNIARWLGICRLATAGFSLPAHSQIYSQSRAAVYLTWLGEWEEALRTHLEFGKRLNPKQRELSLYSAPLIYLALATGRDDLIKKPLDDEFRGAGNDWLTGVAFHTDIRNGDPDKALNRVHSKPDVDANRTLLLHLAKKDLKSAAEWLRHKILGSFKSYDVWPFYFSGGIVVDTLNCELIDPFVEQFKNPEPEMALMLRWLRARYAISTASFEEAAQHLEGIEPILDVHAYFRSYPLLQVLCASLGTLKNPSLAELNSSYATSLSGVNRDLAEMFLGLREPVPNKRWPHHAWRPELRLWLALWLEAKGKPKEAHDVVAPSRDSRYGLTHCQPAIELLLARTSK